MSTTNHHIIAVFPWGDLIEDYLDQIGITIESFCKEMSGGWLFGYIDALKLAGIQTTVFCISAQVNEPIRRIHQPTGATICILPSTRFHRWLRQFMKNPYGWELDETFGPRPRWSYFFWRVLKDIASYVANPTNLIAQEIQKEQCRVILCQEYEYPRLDICVLLGKRLKIPVFATFQGGNFHFSRLEKFIRPFALKGCSGMIVPSQVEIHRLHQTYSIAANTIAQIFNPLDLDLWQNPQTHHSVEQQSGVRSSLNIPESAKVVVCHGRMEIFRKGLDILLEAWQQLCCEHPGQDWWLLLVGTGSDAQELGDRISALPKQNVRWVNEYILDRSVLQQYLCAADLYTMPSRHEGFPVAPLEAMACGLPVVATDVPGIPEILSEGEQSGGLIVPREDPAALAQAIYRLLSNDALRDALGDRARLRVESSFSLEAVGQQLKTFLFRNTAEHCTATDPSH